MKISQIRLYHYELPFKRPIMFKKCVICSRRGLVIEIITDGGICGYGDIAPLPGFSDERIVDVVEEASRVASSLVGCGIPDFPGNLSDRFERWLFSHNLSPSLNCGLQSAIFQILAQKNGESLFKYLNPEAPHLVKVNALLSGSVEDIVAQAICFQENGYCCFKMKVGNYSGVGEAIEAVLHVQEVLAAGSVLRVDANRSWTFEDAVRFSEGVGRESIEYVEEPLRDPTHLVSFSARTGMPCAIDETVSEQGWEYLERWRGVRAAVLKPMVLGGFEITLWLARRAWNVGMVPVITSSFESGVGLLTLAHISAALCQPQLAVGLDTARFFEFDLIKAPLITSDGVIDLLQWKNLKEILDWDKLEEIRYG